MTLDKEASMIRLKFILGYVLVALLISASSSEILVSQNTPSVYSFLLTWQCDPSSTMTIDYHTDAETVTHLQYRRMGDINWLSSTPQRFPFPHSDRFINRVQLIGLDEDTVYEFRLAGTIQRYKFRTMPRELTRPIIFAAGGDMMHTRSMFEKTNLVAAQYDLDFVLIGGDLAYADGQPGNVDRWHDYLEAWSTTMITPDGRMVPHIAAIGNHEIGKYYITEYDQERFDVFSNEFKLTHASFFYGILAFPGLPGYAALDFGDYLSVLVLDSDHTNFTDGAQKQWLRQALIDRRHFRHIMPLYHVPAYPSVRNPGMFHQTRVRQHWVPLFEDAANLRIAFEKHDHAYKRTVPLLKNRRDDDHGVIYLGDGAWGVSTREVRMDRNLGGQPYLERAEAVRHFILIELSDDGIDIKAIDDDGEVFDTHTLNGPVTTSTLQTQLPGSLTLEQNYPNPFNSSTTIQYAISQSANVRLDVFSVAGQLVATLVDQVMLQGWYQTTFSASDLTSGTYIYQLRAGDQVRTRKLLHVK